MTDREKLLAKIQKLMALGNSSNEHEAALAMAKANEIMVEHQIAMAEVMMRDAKAAEPIEQEWFSVPGLRMKYQWVETLAQAAANLFDGDILINRRLHGTTVCFVGFKGEVEGMKQVFLHLWNAWQSFVEVDLERAKRQALQMQGKHFVPRDTMKFKLGHGQAYARRLYWRAKELAEMRSKKVEASTGTALVVVRQQVVRGHIENKYGKGKARKEQMGSTLGHAYGRLAGDKVPLGGAIEKGN